jgi:hypothetical protein
MNILYLISDGYSEFNSSNVRARIPANAINKTDEHYAKIAHSHEWLRQTPRIIQLCNWADVISIQRVAIFESIQHIETWRNRGKFIVVDFDDAYQMIRDDNASYEFWGQGIITKTLSDGKQYKKKTASPVEQFKAGVSKVSAIATPSEQLCLDWSPYLGPSSTYLHIPNYIEADRYKEPFDKNRIIIGWGGSLSHLPSWTDSGVIEALYRVMKNNDNVYLMIVGDNRVIDKLPFAKDRVMFHPYVSWRDWPDILRLFDIGIAPLAGEYDCRRSDLKVSEYIASALPYIATESVVYEKYSDVSGLYVNQGNKTKCDVSNVEGWHYSIEYAIEHIGKLKEMMLQHKHDYRAIYDIDHNVYNILDKYHQLQEVA